MQKQSFFLIAILVLFFNCTQDKNNAIKLTSYVGTDGPGNTYPGATVPFGMVQLSPDNSPNTQRGINVENVPYSLSKN